MNDIIGHKFGLWTVFRRDEQKHSGGSYYICRCECGTERAVVKHDLISGKSWHCGCQSEKVRKRTTELILQRKLNGEYQNKPIDIIGRRYGKLVVLKQLTPGFASRSDFLCRCDCGNEVIKSYNALQAGVRSCGCLSKEKRFDLHGKKFGRLTVLEYISPQNIENEIPSKQRWKNSYGGWIGMWKCRCECGSICYVSTRSLLHGNITSCGCVDKREDLTGKRFGRLVVLEEIPIGDEFYNKFKKRKSDYWKCMFTPIKKGRRTAVHGGTAPL